MLAESPARNESSVAYGASRTGSADERAVFAIRFDRDTEITGGMRLRLWIVADEADDADVFVGVEKVSPTGAPVGFSGYQGVPNDVVAKGWLRLSHRHVTLLKCRGF